MSAVKVFEKAIGTLDTASDLAKLVVRFIKTFGENNAKEIITKLLADPPKKADLSKLDEALAKWRAAHRDDEETQETNAGES